MSEIYPNDPDNPEEPAPVEPMPPEEPAGPAPFTGPERVDESRVGVYPPQPPPADAVAPVKTASNRTLWIVAIIVVVLLLCCCIAIVLALVTGLINYSTINYNSFQPFILSAV